MGKKVAESKTTTVFAKCNEIFTGKKCLNCANTEGNKELASDGLPKDIHAESVRISEESKLLPSEIAK